MRHLSLADYRRVPWANGQGSTVEMLREEGPDGILLRLSMASVVQDGPFSMFPGIERNLTVISGPGFRLEGDLALECRPLSPVAFPGDAAVRAVGTGGLPSEDFNVMTTRTLPRPRVSIVRNARLAADGRTVWLFALDATRVNDVTLARHDLLRVDGDAIFARPGPVIAVQLCDWAVGG